MKIIEFNPCKKFKASHRVNKYFIKQISLIDLTDQKEIFSIKLYRTKNKASTAHVESSFGCIGSAYIDNFDMDSHVISFAMAFAGIKFSEPITESKDVIKAVKLIADKMKVKSYMIHEAVG